jgi:hypothetical protein
MTVIVVAESVTQLGLEVRGAVLVAGSHAGVIAALLRRACRARAVLLNDAGVGKDGAGIAGLAYLEAIGMAATAVAHHSARIGDGADTLARGIVSHVTAIVATCGVAPGMSGRDAAERLRVASGAACVALSHREGRFLVHVAAGVREVWALIRSARSSRRMPGACSSSVRMRRCTARARIPRSGSLHAPRSSTTRATAPPASRACRCSRRAALPP